MEKRKIWIIAAVVAATVVLCLIFALQMESKPAERITVTPVGENVLTLEYGQNYQEAGASVVYSCGDKKEQLTADAKGAVDTRKVGSYWVKYIASYEDVVGTAYRRVHVVDSVAPEITLVSDPEHYTLVGQTYEEEGFSAKDNYDGDITDRVIRQETKEKVTYTVSDSSGNTTTVEREIVYRDLTPPEITLKGEGKLTVMAGTAYREPGWTATDSFDGDLTKNVVVTGGVDIYMPGTYTIKYTVTDSHKNTTTAKRTVVVKAQKAPEVVIPTGKTIYLTFDDGPGPRTPELLDILKKYNVKATFFVMNTAYINTIKRAADEGHAIGIHTTTHKFSQIYANDKAYLNDLYNMQKVIESLIGEKTTLMRFPGGSSNTVSKSYSKGIMTRLTKNVVELGFQYFDWNVDSDDAGSARSAYTVFNNVVEGIGNKKTAIVLQHDIKGYSIDAVERIINWGLSKGYNFLPLSPSSPGYHHPVNN